MELEKRQKQSKGGRPKKLVKRDYPITVKCTGVEKKIIEHKAKKAVLSKSEYLRELGLAGKVVIMVKNLPGEVLALTGALNNVGGLLNQIAKKRNSGEELNALERADLTVLKRRLADILEAIKIRVK